MKTSYFGKLSLLKELKKGVIAISNTVPKGCGIKTYYPLVPPWDLVASYKEGRINEKDYTKRGPAASRIS